MSHLSTNYTTLTLSPRPFGGLQYVWPTVSGWPSPDPRSSGGVQCVQPSAAQVPSPDPWSSGGVQYVQLLARPGRPFVADIASLSNGSYLPNEPSLGDGLCRTNPKTSRWVMPVCCTHPETGIYLFKITPNRDIAWIIHIIFRQPAFDY
jgi:hypothetical protein